MAGAITCLQRELAIFLLGINHARHRSGHADRFVADFAGTGNHIALRVQIHVARRRCGSLFAVVEKVRLAVGHADEHESAATDVSRRWMHHGQGESGGDCGIDGIAAGLHNLHAGARRQFVHAHHNGMLRMHRMGGCPNERR
jgi:hypothetical protein